MPKKPALVVRRLGTNEEIRRIELSNTSERYVEKVLMGLYRNMNVEEFYVDDSEAEGKDTAHV